MQPILYVKKLHEDAIVPTKGTPVAAGYDLYCITDFEIEARERALIPTGIAVQIPHGCYGRVAPRSSLALKFGIDVGAGVIDEDYRGELKVILFNHSNQKFSAKKGERIAQLIIEQICHCPIQLVEELDESGRGIAGFGSTGK